MFIRAVQMLTEAMSDVIVVGVAGPSGAGKTVFTSKVKSFFPGCEMISMDMYNDASRLVDDNFDDPNLTDYDLLVENLRALKEGRSAEVPVYSFQKSKRVGWRTVPPPTARVVVVEGIYALSERLRPLLDLRVSVTGGVHFDLVKRVLRDIDRAGQQPELIIQQISETVYPMYKAFIEPDLQTAHLRIYNTFNPFSGFQKPIYTLKSSEGVSEGDIVARLPQLKKKKESLEYYDIYLLPPNKDPETCNTWIRMRNRDGKYMLMFEEWVTDGPFIISPGISFEVSVKILGGLMALGYDIFIILKRKSVQFTNPDRPGELVVKLDTIEGFEGYFVQVQGHNRTEVAAAANMLGLDGSYVPHSFIEQVQMQQVTTEIMQLTDEMKNRIVMSSPQPASHRSLLGLGDGEQHAHSRPSSSHRHRDGHGGGHFRGGGRGGGHHGHPRGNGLSNVRSLSAFEDDNNSVDDLPPEAPSDGPVGVGGGGMGVGAGVGGGALWDAGSEVDLDWGQPPAGVPGSLGRSREGSLPRDSGHDVGAVLIELAQSQQYLTQQVGHLEKVVSLLTSTAASQLQANSKSAQASEMRNQGRQWLLLGASLGACFGAAAIAFAVGSSTRR